MSAFLMVELTMRSVESLRSSLAFMASLTALLMSSRNMAYPFKYPTPDLGRSRPRDNLAAQPRDRRLRRRFGLFRLRQVPTILENDELRAGNALRHLLRK